VAAWAGRAGPANPAAPITSKHLGHLAGADVFTLGNAAAMVNTNRIDAGILGPFGIHP
jgi:hypothetical protein